MFYCLYYSVSINEPEEKFRITFCYFSIIKNIVAPSSPSNLSVKLVFWGILVFVCLDKSMPMSVYDNFDDMKNLINFLLHSHQFLIFRYAL